MEKIRIIIADDHQLFRNGLKILLNAFPEFEVTGEASNGEEFLKILKNTPGRYCPYGYQHAGDGWY